MSEKTDDQLERLQPIKEIRNLDDFVKLGRAMVAVFPSEERIKDLDELLKLGRYCALVLIMAEAMCLSTLSNMAYMMYAGVDPTVIGCGDATFNTSKEACAALPALIEKTGCEPNITYPFYSVNVEFNYICDDVKIVKNSISLQMVAVLIGALVFGQLSDIFGRKICIIASLVGVALFQFVSAFATNLFWFNILRCINGFWTGGVSAVQGVYIVENIPKKHRFWINTAITWSPNFIIYPIIAYYSGDWRTLSIWGGVIAVAAVIMIMFLYESPRFLIQKGRIGEARDILLKIRKINGDTCEVEASDMENMLKHEQHIFESNMKKQKKHTFYHIVCTYDMLMWTLTLCSGILITSLVNYGLLFNMEKLSGSLYWNSVMFGVIRWSMNIAVGMLDYFVEVIGRKMINFVAVLFNIICLAIVTGFYFLDMAKDQPLIIRICSIGVTAMCAQLYLAKFMTCTELYPTAVRNLSASALSMSSRIGTIFGPQLFYLSDYHPAYPYLALFILAVFDCVTFEVCVPETKGKNLENHLPPKNQRIFYKRPSVVE